MVVVAIAVVASIVGVLVLLGIWACLFYKFYFKKRRKKKQQKEDEESGSGPPPTQKAGRDSKKSETSKSRVFEANQAFNLAYDDSMDKETPSPTSKVHIPAYPNGGVPYRNHNGSTGGGYPVATYTEQYSSDSAASMSDYMDVYGGAAYSVSGTSRISGGSDSEANKSVKFAEDLPTLRGDEPPVDGRTDITRIKTGYWIKPPATPRGKKPLPFKYIGNKNPSYSKKHVNPNKVVSVSVKVNQKTGKRSSREIQQLQPSDVVICDPGTEEPQPKTKNRKLTSSSSSQNNSGAKDPFPLLENVKTAGAPPGGNKPVRQRSILKKPKPDNGRNSNSSMSQSDNATSQSGTDNSMSEGEFGGMAGGQNPRTTTQRRSKRRRPKSIRNVGGGESSANSSAENTPVYGGNPPPNFRVQKNNETYRSINTDSTPPVAQSSPQTPRYQHEPDQPAPQSYHSTPSSEVKPRMPNAYYPPKSPGDRAINDEDEIPHAKPRMRPKADFVNPYEKKAGSGNRSSSDLETSYYGGGVTVTQKTIPFSSGDAQTSDMAVQSRQKRRKKKSQRGNKPANNAAPSKYDNIAFVDDEGTPSMYHNRQSGQLPHTVHGSHGSETEI